MAIGKRNIKSRLSIIICCPHCFSRTMLHKKLRHINVAL